MKLRFLSKLKQFRWSKLLLIWLVFLLIAGVLFAERCGHKVCINQFQDQLPEPDLCAAGSKCVIWPAGHQSPVV